MSRAEREAFLADLHVGVMAVARPDGQPPLNVPVWYAYEPGGDVLVLTPTDSVKARLIEQSGAASLCAQREDLPPAYVTVEGPAVLEEYDEELRVEVARRYLGELADGYLANQRDIPTVVVRIAPQRWRTQDFMKRLTG